MITWSLIGITVLTSFLAFNNPDTLAKCLMNPYKIIVKHEYYRLLTSGFIHQDYGHLFFNMVSLYFFGLGLEQWFVVGLPFGKTLFLLFYLAGIVVSDLPTLRKHRNDRNYNSLGASGGVSSILFAYIILNPTDKIYMYGIIGLPAFAWGALYMLYTVWQSKNNLGSGINHDAHLYGAIFGIIFILVAFPESATNFVAQLMQWSLF